MVDVDGLPVTTACDLAAVGELDVGAFGAFDDGASSGTKGCGREKRREGTVVVGLCEHDGGRGTGGIVCVNHDGSGEGTL